MIADLQNHLAILSKVAGKRITLFDRVGVPKGWVVSTKVPTGFWDKCNTLAIPMEVEEKKMCGAFPSPAAKEMKHWVRKYGEEIMVVLIPDEESLVHFSGGPILLQDLDRDPDELLDEGLASIGKDYILEEMKRRCAMILLGCVDTK